MGQILKAPFLSDFPVTPLTFKVFASGLLILPPGASADFFQEKGSLAFLWGAPATPSIPINECEGNRVDREGNFNPLLMTHLFSN